MPLPPSPSTRRRLVLGGLTAAVGAAVATESAPAQAASRPPLLLGRDNDAGARRTSLTSTGGRAVLQVVQRGSGVGAALYAASTALAATASLAGAWAVRARNSATRTGAGGALRAEGRHNAGLLADTVVADVPAVLAIGGDGTGVAQVATGQSYLDGDALALRAWTGVLAADGTRLTYAPLVSAEAALHTAAGTAAVADDGTAVVALPATFTGACDLTGLVVTLTPVAAAMPGLHVAYPDGDPAARTGFTIAGGAAGGRVGWTAWATRRAVALKDAQAGAVAGPESASDAAPVPVPGQVPAGPAGGPARLERRSLRLPARH